MQAYLTFLGETFLTAGLASLCEQSEALKDFTKQALTRHCRGDWGELDAHDRRLNDAAKSEQTGRIISNYPFPEALGEAVALPDTRLWIITYPGASTTLLFPHEY